MNRNLIMNQARYVRRWVLGYNGGASDGMCYDASIILRHRLRELGVRNCRLCFGRFYNKEHSMFEHYWLNVGGNILDVTADQFQWKIPDIRIPAIIFDNSKWKKFYHAELTNVRF